MKQILVTDIYGNAYEPTYPKRAKGLVKKGRARWIGEDIVCLTCPPGEQEETHMMQYEHSTCAASPAPIDTAEIFRELQKIREDTSHITLAMEKLEKVPTDVGDAAVCQDKIAAIYQVAEAREKTNQALIRLYETMLSRSQGAEDAPAEEPASTSEAEGAENPDTIFSTGILS